MKGLLESAQVEALAREESVRGVMVRQALARAGQGDDAGRALVEKALHLLLERFRALGDGTP